MDRTELMANELKSGAGWRMSDVGILGALNKKALGISFGLPSCMIPITVDGMFVGTIVDQDIRMARSKKIDFAKVEFRETTLPSPVEAIKHLKEVRLGIRELVTLLADFNEYKDNSVLEKIRKEKDLRVITFPGTLFFVDFSLAKSCFTMYSAVYDKNKGTWGMAYWPLYEGHEYHLALIKEEHLT